MFAYKMNYNKYLNFESRLEVINIYIHINHTTSQLSFMSFITLFK